MSVKVLYFASLQDAMGRHEDVINLEDGANATVASIWARVSGGQELVGRLLCAVNMEYAAPETPVADGDEVAFFPPVTGG